VKVNVTLVDNDKGWRELQAVLAKLENRTAYAKAGVIGAKAQAGQHPTPQGKNLSNVDLAVTHEFGVPGRIPQRSFIRRAFDANRDRYIEMMTKLAQAIYDRKTSVRQALGLMGLQAASDIRNIVRQGAGIPPPNSPATIERKGSSRPLIDTAQMIGAVSHAVDLTGTPDPEGFRGGK
jgi:hypothetical protein